LGRHFPFKFPRGAFYHYCKDLREASKAYYLPTKLLTHDIKTFRDAQAHIGDQCKAHSTRLSNALAHSLPARSPTKVRNQRNFFFSLRNPLLLCAKEIQNMLHCTVDAFLSEVCKSRNPANENGPRNREGRFYILNPKA
jgi:hypothetical protein